MDFLSVSCLERFFANAVKFKYVIEILLSTRKEALQFGEQENKLEGKIVHSEMKNALLTNCAIFPQCSAIT